VVGYDKRQPAHLLLLLGWNRKEEEQLQSRKGEKKRLHHKNIKCHTAQKWGLKKKGTFSSSK
jgi:hypothetical protein